jgi:SAM-dependent methyltransferase
MSARDKGVNNLAEEAAAFNRRISERRQAGFIPDIRRAVKCEYFYKSFWRDPHYVDLLLGRMAERHLATLQRHVRPGARILDAGCGTGYFALELARAGYHVVAFDVADKAVAAASETLAANPFTQGFGSLRYEVCSFLEASGRYDAVFISGVLHHLIDLKASVAHLHALLEDGGVVVGYEPCHERWRPSDAAQVALIRGLLSLTGHWYEPPEDPGAVREMPAFEQWVADIHTEYVMERDKNETAGQSPHDNAVSGEEILAALGEHFTIVEHLPGSAFIYRLLGGLRGDDAVIHRIADFLALYECYAVERGFMRPNGFYFTARKRKLGQ